MSSVQRLGLVLLVAAVVFIAGWRSAVGIGEAAPVPVNYNRYQLQATATGGGIDIHVLNSVTGQVWITQNRAGAKWVAMPPIPETKSPPEKPAELGNPGN